MKDIKVNTNYIIYEDGRIYSKYRRMFKSYSLDNSGYYRVSLWERETKKNTKHLVHRLLAEAFLEKPEGHDFVNHIDGDKENNTLSNLEWVTSSYNQKHAYENNLKTLPFGEQNGRALLTNQDVLSIYDKLLKGVL